MYRTFGFLGPKVRYIRQNRGAPSTARARGLELTPPPHELDFVTQASQQIGKGPMEPPMEMTNLTSKLACKQPSARWSHASAVHRTSTNYETQVGANWQGTDGATDRDDHFDMQLSMQTGKRRMEPPLSGPPHEHQL